MKKLLLLTLVLLGGVMQVSAEDVTKRFYIISSGNFGQYRKGNLAIHSWYTGGDVITTWGTPAEEMSSIGTNTKGTNAIVLWYKDVTFDSSKEINIQVYDKGNTKWKSGNLTVTSSSNMYYTFDITPNALLERGDLSYCAYLATGGSWIKQELVTEDNYVYTTTIDNQTSPDPSLELLIAPSFAIDDDLVKTSDLRFTWMFRPWDENQDLGFTDQTSKDGGFYANDNSLKLKSSAYFDLTYKPFDSKYSLSPFRTTTISSVGYSTYSNGEMCTISGATAYTVSANNTSSVTMNEMEAATIWPASAGMILKGESGATVTISAVASDATATTIGTNYLVGTGNSSAVITATENTYVFANDATYGVGFYKASGNGELAAHKAYLDLSKAPGGKAGEFLSFNFDEEETDGISKVANANIDANAQVYNLAGQKVGANYKGIVIVNGKKVVRK